MAIDKDGYVAAFRLLVRDFERFCEYVEPHDSNRGVFSHRLYELLLRACTEFESVCKDALAEQGKKGKTMVDYRALEATWDAASQKIGVTLWRPEPVYVTPLSGWASASPGWYKAYNAVKHNRRASFASASLVHVRDALAGLFLALDKIEALDWRNQIGVSERAAMNGRAAVIVFSGSPFTLVKYEVGEA